MIPIVRSSQKTALMHQKENSTNAAAHPNLTNLSNTMGSYSQDVTKKHQRKVIQCTVSADRGTASLLKIGKITRFEKIDRL